MLRFLKRADSAVGLAVGQWMREDGWSSPAVGDVVRRLYVEWAVSLSAATGGFRWSESLLPMLWPLEKDFDVGLSSTSDAPEFRS